MHKNMDIKIFPAILYLLIICIKNKKISILRQVDIKRIFATLNDVFRKYNKMIFERDYFLLKKLKSIEFLLFWHCTLKKAHCY